MTKAQAHAVLDAARAGLPVSVPEISDALFVTGDIGYRPEPDNRGYAVPEFEAA